NFAAGSQGAGRPWSRRPRSASLGLAYLGFVPGTDRPLLVTVIVDRLATTLPGSSRAGQRGDQQPSKPCKDRPMGPPPHIELGRGLGSHDRDPEIERHGDQEKQKWPGASRAIP